jgi:hypothetical protein
MQERINPACCFGMNFGNLLLHCLHQHYFAASFDQPASQPAVYVSVSGIKQTAADHQIFVHFSPSWFLSTLQASPSNNL